MNTCETHCWADLIFTFTLCVKWAVTFRHGSLPGEESTWGVSSAGGHLGQCGVKAKGLVDRGDPGAQCHPSASWVCPFCLRHRPAKRLPGGYALDALGTLTNSPRFASGYHGYHTSWLCHFIDGYVTIT